MKNSSFYFLIYFIILLKLKINSLKSFMSDKLEDGDKLAQLIVTELSNNDKQISDYNSSDIFDKEDFSFDDKKNCPEIKKLGQQKKFCEKKIPSKVKKEIFNCMKKFCSECCDGDNNQCHKNCSDSHSLFPDHDPEELLLSICSLKNTSDSFYKVCDSLILNRNSEEYKECFSNMCFDCCHNELGIDDMHDKKMKKCIKECKTLINVEKQSNNKNIKNIIGGEAVIQKKEEDNYKEKKSDDKIENLKFEQKSNNITPEKRKKENLKICGNILLTPSKSTIKNFGKVIHSNCSQNFFSYKFKNPEECLDNICDQCCNILDEEMKIKTCGFECKKNSKINLETVSDKSNSFQKKASSNESLVENQSKSTIEKTIEIDKNLVNFSLIKSICDTKYFKDCHETLCNDFCMQSFNIYDSDCVKKCNLQMKSNNSKNNTFAHIIKLHGQFKIKKELEKDEKKKESEFEIEKVNHIESGLEQTIQKSREKIKILKEKLLEEQKNLLNMYKIKKK